MKLLVMVFNSMFMLMFISAVIAEWGKPVAIIAGIGLVSVFMNGLFILLRTRGDFEVAED